MPEELRQPPKHDTPELAEERDKTIEVQDVESDLPAALGHVTLDEWDSICEAVEDMRRKNLLE